MQYKPENLVEPTFTTAIGWLVYAAVFTMRFLFFQHDNECLIGSIHYILTNLFIKTNKNNYIFNVNKNTLTL